MQIKDIFFPLPIVVDIINDNNEEERKILFFDQHQGSFLPIDSSISEDNLNLICKQIFEKFNSIEQEINTFEQQSLIPIANLKKIPEYIQKVKELKEGHFDKFGKIQSES